MSEVCRSRRRALRLQHNTPHADAPAVRPRRPQLGPVAIHWYGLTYLAAFGLFVLLATRRLQSRAVRLGPGPRRLEPQGRRGHALPWRAGRRGRRAARLLPVLQAGLLRVASAGDLLRLAGRHELPWRHARRHRFAVVVRALARQAVLAGDGFRRALRAAGPGRGPRGQLHQRRTLGPRADPALPWAMVFPQSGSMVPRHPSQVYQFLLEGVLLFVVLWLYARKERKQAQVSAVVPDRLRRCCASLPSSSANPTPTWACCRWA